MGEDLFAFPQINFVAVLQNSFKKRHTENTRWPPTEKVAALTERVAAFTGRVAGLAGQVVLE